MLCYSGTGLISVCGTDEYLICTLSDAVLLIKLIIRNTNECGRCFLYCVPERSRILFRLGTRKYRFFRINNCKIGNRKVLFQRRSRGRCFGRVSRVCALCRRGRAGTNAKQNKHRQQCCDKKFFHIIFPFIVYNEIRYLLYNILFHLSNRHHLMQLVCF